MSVLSLRRRTLYVILSILGLFLLGTVVVLSSVSYYLAIDAAAYLSETEVPLLDNVTRWNASEHGQVERIPRILHQTWKSETLPVRWRNISQECRDMMPDYEYMLWTDASSREFIAQNYPWYLDNFDAYTYPIQRADAIRYFVLYHYGGIYIDLDIGCLKPIDPLLVYPVVLPKTNPVGVSNDLMFAEKGHPFLAQTIHNLITFDHSWILNYPTVMFSTGPMFLSAQYGLYTSSHPSTPENPGGEVRILPKSLYGKNAKAGEAPNSFFSHFYGSSWHADDAAFIGFLGHWGKVMMWIGLAILIFGVGRLLLSSNSQRKYSLRRIGGYDVMLPRWTQRNGRWHLDVGWLSLPGSSTGHELSGSGPSSPIDGDDVSLLPLPFGSRPSSPSASDVSSAEGFGQGYSQGGQPLFAAFRRAGHRAMASITGSRDTSDYRRAPTRSRRQRSRGVLFFLPAYFTRDQDVELGPHSHRRASSSSPRPPPFSRSTSAASTSQAPPEKQRYPDDDERAGLGDAFGDNYPSESHSHARPRSQHPSRNASPAPPPLI
ncbi:glycosyltransferase family 32 protein [Plicaturopsis crispa FD-325 SS-3]|nr:glycosyltransferase family 32 protein [Plicaturopsis crispa FD-325 SS-3]